ncbi:MULTISPECIES: hypothetical protein [unclassified Pseudomonas]|uniref:hypothetical protein n=1 Tax=unclassified Pseudomonas TaxID=196821 RepID=UPI002B22B4CC|nr:MULTISPECIES: hypothetical protein [unclassified Pseudomonas]MEB0133580.1 hypothetical protein [Pseudomonas sp. CCI2.4]MEB0167957.1 hypothetical protein [Pseudomonas sp. CCC4.4]
MDSTDQATADASAPAVNTPASAQTLKSPFSLTVKFAFADYQQGQRITDATEVAAVLAGENAANVLKTAA